MATEWPSTGNNRSKEGFRGKIKTFFHISKEEESLNLDSSISQQSGKNVSTVLFGMVDKLGPENDTSDRLKAMKNLESVICSRRLEASTVETIWMKLEDMVMSPGGGTEVWKTESLQFVSVLISNQYSQLTAVRPVIFSSIQQIYRQLYCSSGTAWSKEAKVALFNCLVVLTKNGSRVEDFGERIAPFLTEWCSQVLSCSNTAVNPTEFLSFLQCTIRDNGSWWEKETISDIVTQICVYACGQASAKEIEQSLSVLNVILRFGLLPRDTLLMVVTTLCKLVNKELLSGQCWRLTRSIFGSHLGYASIHVLCNLLQASEAYPDETVLRGAVFFIGMGLWGSQRVESLRFRPAAVLPSFQSALSAKSLIVLFEVLLSLQRLVQKYGRDLQLVTWHLVIGLIENAMYCLGECCSGGLRASSQSGDEGQCQRLLQEIITCIEQLYDSNAFGGWAEQLFGVVELCARQRPENSILRLLSYRSQAINPLKPGWLEELNKLLSGYYLSEGRCSIRIKTLNILRNVYTEQRHVYGGEIVEGVVLPLLGSVAEEKDSDVQEVAINFLCDVAKHWYDGGSPSFLLQSSPTQKTTDLFFEVVALVESFVNGKLKLMDFSKYDPDVAGVSEAVSQYFENVERAVCGVLEILEAKWCSWPPTHAFHLLNLLALHVKLNYDSGAVGYLGGGVRDRIFQSLLGLRAHPSSHHLGMHFHQQDGLTLSPYAYCYVSEIGTDGTEETPVEKASFKWTTLSHAVTGCLQKELWWPALKTVFRFLPALLKNRTLVLSSPESVAQLCSVAAQITADPRRATKMVGAPENFTMSELNDALCPTLSSLVVYRKQLSIDLQKKLVMAIQNCLVSEKSTAAVMATVGCALELPDSVQPMCRDLMRRLAELPSSPRLVIPIMELISTVIAVRNVRQHFTERHFLYVLDILIPCTSSEQFTSFIVSMAYHLLFRWFLVIPHKFRKSAAAYIIKKMEANTVLKKVSVSNSNAEKQLSVDTVSVMKEFLQHFTYFDAPLQAKQRCPKGATINGHGLSKSWIVGNRVFTVTTTEFSQQKTLCSKCLCFLRSYSSDGNFSGYSEMVGEESVSEDFLSARRRHASAIQNKVTQDPPTSQPFSMDDCFIRSGPKVEALNAATKSIRFEEATGGDPGKEWKLAMCSCWRKGQAVIDIRHCFGRISWPLRINDQQLDVRNVALLRSYLLTVAEDLKYSGNRISDASSTLSNTLNPNHPEVTFRQSEWDMGAGAATVSANSDRCAAAAVDTESKEDPSEINHSEPLSVDVALCREESTPLEGGTPTSTTSSAYFSVRSGVASSQDVTVCCEEKEVCFDPTWVFNQLCSGLDCGQYVCDIPTEKTAVLDRSLRNLDRIAFQEAHKIGVVYAAPRQVRDEEILGNQFGSERYMKFLEGLGELISLKEVNPNQKHLGGLEPGQDGKYTYYWEDPVTQVVFHVSTLMPNKESDPSCTLKKRHIGNDFVVIYYNDTGREYRCSSLSGQLSYVVIVVEPEDPETLSIKLLAKDEITRWLSLKDTVVSDGEASLLCRQMAMRAELSAKIWQAQQNNPDQPYISLSLERLRHIQQMRDKFENK